MELDAPPPQEMSYADNVKKRYNEQGCLNACFFTMCCCFCCNGVCTECLGSCCDVCNSCTEYLGSCCLETLSSCCSF